MVKIVEDIFGVAINPFTNMAQVVRRYTMSNPNRLSVSIIQLGAMIQDIRFPDAYHNVENIILGFDDIAGYLTHQERLFGCVLGRVAERVSNGEFVMDERKVLVSRNLKNKHQLNGGFLGFNRVIWDLHEMRPDGITLHHLSPDGHEGYPGNLNVYVHYTMDDDNRFYIRFEANTDHMTPVNITNHCYFNLGSPKGAQRTLGEHQVRIAADNIIERDEEKLPTSKFLRVDDTVNDLRLPVFLGDRLRQLENSPSHGYDVCYAFDKDFEPTITRFMARFLHPKSGRFMEVFSNQPAMHFETANEFPFELNEEEPIIGKECTRFWRHSGFSLQLQKFPDSMNNLDFPTVYIMPGEHYFHETIYRFGIKESWKCCATEEEIVQIENNLGRMEPVAVKQTAA